MSDMTQKINHEFIQDLRNEIMELENEDLVQKNMRELSHWKSVMANVDPDKCWQIRIAGHWYKLKNRPQIKELLQQSCMWFAFQHDKDEKVNRTHVHLYLFDCDYAGITIRQKLKKEGFKGNSDFSLKGTAGDDREPITPEGAYRYGTTVSLMPPTGTDSKWPEIVWEYLGTDAKEYYESWREENEIEDKEEFRVVVLEKQITKKDNTWEYIQGKLSKTEFDLTTWSVQGFKAWIIKDWLDRGKAIPRSSDLHRYAVSLWLMRRSIREKDFVENTAKEADIQEIAQIIKNEKSTG